MAYDVQGRKIPDTQKKPGSGVYYGKEPGSKYVKTPSGGFEAWSTSSGSGPSGYLGVEGALNPPPQIQQFYQALLGARLRAIGGQGQSARTGALNALEARGMGQSSEVGRTFAEIGQGQAMAGQEAANSVQALQFQQYLSAMDYERQRKLAEQQHKYNTPNPWYKALGDIASAGGNYYAYSKYGGGGGTNPGQPYEPQPWMT